MSVATRSAVPVRKFSNNPLIAFYQSSIGKKLIVAVTALVLILYVLGHLLGNLQIYIGQDRINTYAKFLHDLGPILWVIRVFLLAAFVTHEPLANLTRPAGLLQRQLDFLLYPSCKLVAQDETGTGVPAQQRIVVFGWTKPFGLFVPTHRFKQ